uniref:Actin filament-associated protein 1-like 1 n=1 Tax=Denticeps clupeoides TaxID=299321 RepID=A0AAY4ASC5_9TELE
YEINSAMEHLVTELNVLLKLLDHETVSSATSEKMTVVRNLLRQLQPSVNGTDFIYMNTSIYGNGTSFVESLFEEFDCDLQELRDSEDPTDTPPPLPTTPPPEDYYEEAVPLDPGKSPQYITTRRSTSPPKSIEDAYYEDADNNYPTTQMNAPRKNSDNDSDALSSSYESYDEEDEETKVQEQVQQWPSPESSLGPVKDCRIADFLLRKKRFGQWAKQLTVISENRLQCYKNPKDHMPQFDLPLNLCQVIYVPKDGRRKKHELRFSLPGAEALVLAVQNKEQAERWLKVQDVSSNMMSGSSSPMIQKKIELDKGKKGPFSDLTGSMSRAAGRKINRIISFSKKKPPLPGEPPQSSLTDGNPRCGYLNVLVNQSWRERWCCVRGGTLYLHKDRGDTRTHVNALTLQGAEIVPGLGAKHPFAFRIMRGGSEVAALEVAGPMHLHPDALHYDYVDVETIGNIRDAARHSFLSASIESRTYDEVPYESQEALPRSEVQLKRRSSFSSGETPNAEVTVKRHGSAVNQYGKYGKTRAEEDAKRYLQEKEVLEKEKNVIRETLVSLRKEKKEVKQALKDVQKGLEQRLAQLEESCRLKEGERVDLELRLTGVKENLKKSLSGGVLGVSTEKKASSKNNKVENLYSEASAPVNSAAEMRKRPPSMYASGRGNVMQKAKEWESKKGS